MEKIFELERITFLEYENLAMRFHIPPVTVPGAPSSRELRWDFYAKSESRVSYTKRLALRQSRDLTYFRLLNQITYDSIDSLLDSFFEEPNTVHTLWFPHGDLSTGEAQKRTETDPAYLDYLKSEATNHDRFLVRCRSYRGIKLYRNDAFDYSKEFDLWVLRGIEIQNQNFGRYEFSILGIDIHSTPLYVIPAIHDKQVPTQ